MPAPQTQPDQTVLLPTMPGIQRDGTALDSKAYTAGQWVRFQRGRPKKMGGYRLMTNIASGPVRYCLLDTRLGANRVHLFSGSGIEQLTFDQYGNGSGLINRTPTSGYTTDYTLQWTADKMSSTSGSTFTDMICCATPDLNDITSDTAGNIWNGDITTGAALTQIVDGSSAPITTSGGICVVGPFLFVYGSFGTIRNSDINNPTSTGWSVGGSSYSVTSNPVGDKILCGLPIRGGTSSPAALFWSINSVIRMTFTGGTTIWNFDVLSSNSTMMSKQCVVEADGVYYWAGIDRFYVYNGVVQELPNTFNQNFFFDNINIAARSRVWGLSIPRWGEIWWFFPSGTATECTNAIIYNYREQCWYDCTLARYSGIPAQGFPYPVEAGSEDSNQTTLYTVSIVTLQFEVGETIVGQTSGATAVIFKVASLTKINVINQTGTFTNGEVIVGSITGARYTITVPGVTQELDTVWQHEYGHDKVAGQNVTAIYSNIQTSVIAYPTGGVFGTPAGVNFQTNIDRVEPDFVQVGSMNAYVIGKSFANSTAVQSVPYPFTSSTEYIDMREQRREPTLMFESNVAGGFYEMGKIVITMKPGDARG